MLEIFPRFIANIFYIEFLPDLIKALRLEHTAIQFLVSMKSVNIEYGIGDSTEHCCNSTDIFFKEESSDIIFP